MGTIHFSDCWAKTDPLTGLPALGVAAHCQIVGLVAEILWLHTFSRVRELLPAGTISLAACHDIGKITPGFQRKCLHWRLPDSLIGRLFPDGIETNHAVVSQWHLQQICPFQSREWMISTGGHHGRYPGGWRPMGRSVIPGRPPAPPFSEGGLDQEFCAARQALVEELISRFGTLPDTAAAKQKERVHLLTGFTILADWIGSNTDWFLPSDGFCEDTARRRAQQCMSELGLQPAIIPKLRFEQQFRASDSATDFSPRPLQQLFIDAVDIPGLYILEAPMDAESPRWAGLAA